MAQACDPSIGEAEARGSEVQAILSKFEATLEPMGPCLRNLKAGMVEHVL